MKAIRIHETGGPEVMRLEEIETPTPTEGEILVKVAAAGINYADLAQRAGTYLTRTRTPMTLGVEVAGTVAALGPGITSPVEGARRRNPRNPDAHGDRISPSSWEMPTENAPMFSTFHSRQTSAPCRGGWR